MDYFPNVLDKQGKSFIYKIGKLKFKIDQQEKKLEEEKQKALEQLSE